MYPIDQDRVVELTDLPRSDVGAPLPLLLSDEHVAVVAYYTRIDDPAWDGSYVHVVDPATSGSPMAVIRFEGYRAVTFGPPNDEAFSGHPLASRGLRPYRAFEVHASSWIHQLERMNAVHRHHTPELFADDRHFILAFHDSTLECIARSYTVHHDHGPLDRIVSVMRGLLSRT